MQVSNPSYICLDGGVGFCLGQMCDEHNQRILGSRYWSKVELVAEKEVAFLCSEICLFS